MRSYSASKAVPRLLSVLVLSGMLFGFVGLPWPVVRAQDPEEEQIAYIGEDGNLWLMNMDGSNQAQLTHLTEDKVRLYTWSPDGRRIAFLGEVSHKLYVVTVADMSLHQVAGIERIHQFVWSPNGEMLAIVTGGGSWGDDNRILLVELANWEIREVADGYAVQWALDGRQWFYVSNYREVEEPLQEIRVVSTDGDVHIVVESREWGTSWPIETLTLSPNGAWIAVYVSGLEFEGTLWTLRTDGSELRQIVEYIQPNQFDWSPDGDWLVYRDSGDPFRTGEGGGARPYQRSNRGNDNVLA